MLYTLHHTHSAFAIQSAFADLRKIIAHRMHTHFNEQHVHFKKWLGEHFDGNLFKKEILQQVPQIEHTDEWIILLLALVPHSSPDFFECIIREHLPAGGDFPEFGGVKGTNHRSMLPTGETAQFILAGANIGERLQVHRYFQEDHFFYKQNILWLEPVKEGEPVMSGRIVLSQELVDKLLLGKETLPRFGLDFPARRIVTEMNWQDVVLNSQTAQQVKEIGIWLQHHHRLATDSNLKRKIKPGYRVLFYGPSGTGKTLTAALIGKEYNKEVYRIDLSQVVSKYIGETEKNLEQVFKRAESKNWILFFDEADALFGKRTNVQSSHDKYANQEVSYLLQRVEDYPGLLILASNFKTNLDDAFLRRFHAMIHFPLPSVAERLALWQKAMPSILPLDDNEMLQELARRYEMSGAAILNAVQFAVLMALSEGSEVLNAAHLLEGIRKEFIKEEKSI
jgi:AAA+ superfamily predicted ATPase